MDSKYTKSSIAFNALTRENLYKAICESLTEKESASDIFQKGGKGTEQTKKVLAESHTDVRYYEEKCSFLLMMFGPMLETYITYRKNDNFDYMTGLHLFMSSNPNFQYGFGMFKKSIAIYEELIEHWDKFLDAVIYDINSLPSISLIDTIVLRVENLLCFRIKDSEIKNISVDIQNFDSILIEKGTDYKFSFVLIQNGKPQQLITGTSNGKGKDGSLYNTISWLNEAAVGR